MSATASRRPVVLVLGPAREAMERGFEIWANPSSPHAEGRAARAALEGARERIKAALGWDGEVIFTSGATEALFCSAFAFLDPGDEVIVFGKDLKVEELASRAGTIPYEIMTGISQRVKRVFFEE